MLVRIGLPSLNTRYTLHRPQNVKRKLIRILLSGAYEMQYLDYWFQVISIPLFISAGQREIK